MSLISGKEALIALANGEEVELQVFDNMNWHDSAQWTVNELLCFKGKFRIKPQAITINGIEVPAPFEPKDGEKFCYLSDESNDGFHTATWNNDRWLDMQFGAWRTEEEIKQVVEALRHIFK